MPASQLGDGRVARRKKQVRLIMGRRTMLANVMPASQLGDGRVVGRKKQMRADDGREGTSNQAGHTCWPVHWAKWRVARSTRQVRVEVRQGKKDGLCLFHMPASQLGDGKVVGRRKQVRVNEER